MNSALRIARSKSLKAKIAMKIKYAKEGTEIDRHETSFAGSYWDIPEGPKADSDGRIILFPSAENN